MRLTLSGLIRSRQVAVDQGFLKHVVNGDAFWTQGEWRVAADQGWPLRGVPLYTR